MQTTPQGGEGSKPISPFGDRFEQARENLWGQPGFQRRNTTITASGWSFFPEATWIVETIRAGEDSAIFLQCIDKEGGQRFVLPRKVCEAIYRQADSIKKKRRSEGAKQAMEKRKLDPNYQPFGGKPFRKA